MFDKRTCRLLLTQAARHFGSNLRLFSSVPPKVNALNHVAIAVPDVSKAAEAYRTVFGAEVSDVSVLEEHGVKVCFVMLANTKLELMEPFGQSSPIANFLKRNPSGGVHHICLEVDDVRQSVAHVAQHVAVLNPEPKLGAHGTPVVFLHPKDTHGVLVELEEVSTPMNKEHGIDT